MSIRKIEKVGWIGTGVMGNSMCQHLLNQKIDLQVHNRTASKADNLVKLGATYSELKEMASSVDCLVLMLGYPKDVEQILIELDLIKYMKKDSLLIDHTTSRP